MKRNWLKIALALALCACTVFALAACGDKDKGDGDDRCTHVPGAAIAENTVAATCYASGSYDEVVYCVMPGCGAEISRTAKTIASIEHTPAAAVQENMVAATCTVNGSYDEVVYCSIDGCGAEISRENKVITSLGHTPGTPVIENSEAANCFTGGTYDEVVYCSASGCGVELSREEKTVPATGDHTPASAVRENEVAATCTVNGSYDEVVYCSVLGCGAEIYREAKTITAPGHTPAAAVRENMVASTCTVNGSYDEVVYCSVSGCGAELSRENNIITAVGAHTSAAAVRENEVAATCTVDGSYDEVVYCSVSGCGAEISRTAHTIAAPGHTLGTPVVENNEDANCFEGGSYDEVVYCSASGCGVELSREEKSVPATGVHTPGAPVPENIIPASCYATGSCDAVVYCSVSGCRAEISRTPTIIDKLAHTPAASTLENIVGATCTVDGFYDEVVYCSVSACGAEISREHKTLAAPGHTPAVAVRENEVTATCYAEGSYDEVLYCSVAGCGAEISRTAKTIEKTAHTPADAVIENTVEATCTVDGSYDEVVYCSVDACRAELSREGKTITAPGHIEAVDAAVAPTCTETGLTEGKHCSVCTVKLVEQTVVSATGHSFGEWTETKAPTESETGEKRRDCSQCDAFETDIVALLAHDHSRWPTTIIGAVAPTCTATGLTEGEKCSKCGEILVAQNTVPANGHTHAEAVRENEIAATCTVDGSYDEVVYCSVSGCGVELSRENKVILADHAYVDYTCTACGISLPTCTGLAFTSNGDGTCYVKGIGGCTDKDIVIPVVSPGGERVTAIGSSAFRSNTSITSVTIPASIINIAGWAFYGCSSLRAVYITDLEAWCNISFDDCDANPLYNGADLYLDGELITELMIPDGVTAIKDYAFSRCTGLTSVTIPSSVTSIGELAFYYCTSLTSVTIGSGVTSIGTSAFEYNCYKLVEVINKSSLTITKGSSYNGYIGYYALEIHSGESKIDNVDGYLFITSGGENYLLGYIGDDKDLTLPDDYKGENYSIYNYAFYNRSDITSVDIPDSVTNIGRYAFYNCTGLTSVTIGSGVTSVGSDAFYYCTSLTSITIPDSVTSIGDYAFYGCTSLSAVCITDIAAWCNISFGNERANPLYYAKNLYLDGELIAELVIPDGVTAIKNYAFYNCTSLTSVTIPSSVTSIGSSFSGCYKLVEVINKSSLTITKGAGIAGYALEVHSGESKIDNIGGYLFYTYEGVNYLLGYIGDSKELVLPDNYKGENYVIHNYAFYERSDITSVTIPSCVTSIGYYAFSSCTGLTGVYITDIAAWCNISFSGSSANPLYYAKNLYLDGELITELVIPEGVTTIKSYAFYNCNGLTSISIPDSVTSIGEYAFTDCDSLRAVYITDLEAWCNISFDDYDANPLNCARNLYLDGKFVAELIIPDGITAIKDYTFYGCTGLTSVTLPSGVTSIGEDAFYGCSELVEVINNSSLEITKGSSSNGYIGYYALYVHSGENEIDNVDGYLFTTLDGENYLLGYIGDDKNLELPDNYKGENYSIYKYAFYNRGDITSVTIPVGVTSIGNYAFYGCTGLTSVVIGSGVKSIGSSAFFDCTVLNAVHITDIAAWCNISFGSNTANPLYYANNLYLAGELVTELVIPDSVTAIKGYAFYNCAGLTSVAIGNCVTSIGRYAFEDCTGLEEIYFNATAMNDLSSSNYVFYNAGKNGDGIKVVVGKNVTKIPAYLFYGCSYITSVEFEEGSVCESIGSYAFYRCTGLASVTIGSGVTSIGERAFSDCTDLTTIIIPNSIESIGSYAFYSCTRLRSITIPAGIASMGYYAFYGCRNLEEIYFNAISMNDLGSNNYLFSRAGWDGDGIEVVIGKNVTKIPAFLFNTGNDSSNAPKITSVEFEEDGVCESIGAYAFYYCTDLTSITIPDSVTSIGSGAFRYCTGLEEIYFNATAMNDLSSDNYVFRNAGKDGAGIKVVIGKNATKIPAYLFYRCSYITSVEFEEGSVCESIGSYTFNNCTGLTSVTIPNCVSSIGNYAFEFCTRLTSVTIGSGVESIGSCAFSGCTGLTSVTIGSAVKSIGSYAFNNCTRLTSITIPNNVTSIGSYAFYRCTGLTSITIPDSVMSIGSYAFNYCGGLKIVYITDIAVWCDISFGSNTANPLYWAKNLYLDGELITELVIPDCVTAIKDYVFYNCTSLTSVTIPDSVTNIGSSAFSYCYGLNSVAIGSGVTSIGNDAFSGCTGLEEIYFNATAMADLTVDNHVFFNAGKNGDGIKVIIGKNVTRIPAYLFCPYSSDPSYAPRITRVEFEEGSVCAGIGNNAFEYCSDFTNFAIPNSITDIGDYAFAYCHGLTAITIGSEVASIGDSAFYECYKLAEVVNNSSYVNATKGVYDNGYIGYYALEVHSGESKIDNVDGYLFYTYDDENYLLGYIGEDKDLILPEAYKGENYKIHKYAFYERSDLTSVTIPNSVTSIGNSAFYNCTALEEIYFNAVAMNDLNSNNYVFSNAGKNGDGIKVVIGKNVTKIPAYLFSDCSYITIVEFEEGSVCESIGNSAFYNCTSLEEIYFNATCMNDLSYNNYIFSYAGQNGEGIKVVIGKNVTKIPAYLFYGCSYITSVEFEEGSVCESIGYYAFQYCTGAIEVVDGVSYVDKWVIDCDASVTGAVLRSDTVGIADYAFYGCTGLTSITIPDSVNSIGNDAFYGCTNLSAVCITDIAAWCNISFGNEYANPLVYAKNLHLDGDLITNLVIPEGVTAIPMYAFKGQSSITSVTIPDSVTSIGDFAFYRCTGLTSVTIGSAVKSIGSDAFYNCTRLTSITIPNNVTSIGSGAFRYCTGLEEIYFNATAMNDLSSFTNYVFDYAGKNGDGIKVVVGKNVTRMPAYLFYGCNYITSVEFEEGSVCESIGDFAFKSCTGLTSVTIPESVTSVGCDAFYFCYKLVEVINKSELTITKGSTGNGFIGCYAFYVHSGESKIDNVDGYLFITYEGVNYLLGYIGDDNDLTLPENYKGENYSIYKYAFYNHSDLTSVTIPNSVTSIGSSAFSSCTGLTSVTIGGSVTSIGYSAFYNCTGLEEIYFNATCMNDLSEDNCVFSYAGQSCDGIKVVIGKNVTKIPAYLFYPDSYGSYYAPKITIVEFEDGSVCSSIGEYAFCNCTGLTSVTIPNSVTSIGSYAFSGCTGLTLYCDVASKPVGWNSSWNYSNRPVVWAYNNVTTNSGYDYVVHGGKADLTKYKGSATKIVIPSVIDGYEVVGFGSIFANNTTITSVYIPSSITLISPYAFYKCTAITSVTIGSGVESIGSYAFSGCTSLSEVHVADIAAWCNISFANYYTNPLYSAKNLYLDDELITKLVIPEGVTYISPAAFCGCTSITSVTIPNSVTRIGDYALAYCTSLKSVTIGSSVERIGDYAFLNCASLTSVAIPGSATSIGYRAFANCTGLARATFANPNGWWGYSSPTSTSGTWISATYLANASKAATYLKETYKDYYWKK